MAKRITLLGSTGSIGTQALDVIRREGYEVAGLAAHSNVALLQKQIAEFHPRTVAVTDEDAAQKLEAALAGTAGAPRVVRGAEGLRALAAQEDADVVLNAVVGIAGLPATLAALESGRDVALANKESLVTGGKLVTGAAAENGAKLLPVDSEHSAIFQCLQDAYSAKRLQKILLTASGGPFFGKTRAELQHVTKRDALRHPNWSMGAKITIDSATLMNKGLELIEAAWLFDLAPEKNPDRGAASEHHPFDGAVHRPFDPRAAGRAGYAHPHPVCAHLARTWRGHRAGAGFYPAEKHHV